MIKAPAGEKVVLVTGGAGFIGSHTSKALFRQGYRPVVFDNLSSGHRDAVKWGDFVHGDIRDRGAVGRIMADYRPSADVGTGKGHAVLEVVAAVDRALDTSTLYLVGERREGDPACLVADPSKVRERFGWTASNSRLTRIVETAAAWRRAPKVGAGIMQAACRFVAGLATNANLARFEGLGVSEPA